MPRRKNYSAAYGNASALMAKYAQEARAKRDAPAPEPAPRTEPAAGRAWSKSHDGEWPEGFGPGHPDYDDTEER